MEQSNLYLDEGNILKTDEMNVSKWDAEVAACSVPFKDFMNAADLQTKYRTYVI